MPRHSAVYKTLTLDQELALPAFVNFWLEKDHALYSEERFRAAINTLSSTVTYSGLGQFARKQDNPIRVLRTESIVQAIDIVDRLLFKARNNPNGSHITSNPPYSFNRESGVISGYTENCSVSVRKYIDDVLTRNFLRDRIAHNEIRELYFAYANRRYGHTTHFKATSVDAVSMPTIFALNQYLTTMFPFFHDERSNEYFSRGAILLEGVYLYWNFRNIKIAVPKPIEIHRDEQGHLHNPKDMAVKWMNGDGFYVLNGIEVQARHIFHPENIRLSEVMENKNIEVGRVLLPQMGFERFKQLANYTVEDTDSDGAGQPRELLRFPAPRRDPDGVVKIVHVTCPSTGHNYYLRVPPQIRTCQAGVAWSYGLEAKDYNPIVEG